MSATPQCSCAETTGGTGLITTCSETISALGVQLNVGARVQLEPCGEPAFAQIEYQFGDDWESAGRIEAGDEPLLVPIPGASFPIPVPGYSGAGLYIALTVAGNAADLSVHAHLSVCLNKQCDGDTGSGDALTSWVGPLLTNAGFPLPLLEFDDLAFMESCPAESSSMIVIIIAAAAAGAAILAGAVTVVCFLKKRRAARNTGLGTQSGVVISGVVPEMPVKIATASASGEAMPSTTMDDPVAAPAVEATP